MSDVKKCDRCGKEINGGLVYQGKDINGNMHYLCMDCIMEQLIKIKDNEQEVLEVEDE